MRTARTLIVCLLVAGLTALPAATAEARPNVELAKIINKYRAKYGKRALRWSTSLARSSGAYADWMMRNDYFGHQSRIRASRKFRRLGECISYHSGWRLRVRETVVRWMRSRRHRAILLSSRYRWIGAGWRRGYFRGRRATIWVVQVGA